MIKVNLQTLEVTREPIPPFLDGIYGEALQDLSWTDPQLGVNGYGWWSEKDDTPIFDTATHTFDGTESFAPDLKTYTVKVVRGIRAKTEDEIAIELSNAKSAKLEELASLRYAVETGGLSVNGAMIKTDRDSQVTLTGAYVAVQQNPSLLIDWKSETGWIQIDKTTVESLCMAVTAHVQGCFSKERVLTEQINALETVTEVSNFDILGAWDAI